MKTNNTTAFAKTLALCGAAIAASAMMAGASPLISSGYVKQFQATDPKRGPVELTSAEQSFVARMQQVIATSQQRGALDVTAMNRVFGDAFRANVSAESIGVMVADLTKAFPGSLTQITSSAIAPANGVPSMELVWEVMNSAVMNSPRPFSNVLPVRDSVVKLIDFSRITGMDNYIKYATIRLASATPDNPLNAVAYDKRHIGTELEQMGIAIKRTAGTTAGLSALFLEGDVGLNPFFTVPQPTSPPSGSN